MRYYTDTNLNSALSLKLTDRRVFQAFVLSELNTIPIQPPLSAAGARKALWRNSLLNHQSLVELFLERSPGANLWRPHLQPAFDIRRCSLSFRSWRKTPDSNTGEDRWGAGLVIPDLRVEADVPQSHSWTRTATLNKTHTLTALSLWLSHTRTTN